jgi:predicted patatin/cPLA2 family phospholipase
MMDHLLENRSISIYSYNLETVLAEKLETILSRSIANTRMRDFYNIHILISIKHNMFMQDIFRAAFSATSKFRDSQYSQDEIKKIIQTIKSSSELESNWYQYQSRNDFAHELTYSDVCSSLEKLICML